MATKKSGKGGRAKASRAKTTARGRTTKPTPKKKTAARTAKPVKVAKKPTAAKRTIAKPLAENAEMAALKARFGRERSGLEKRLTETVREIGLLRHHELRAGHLETQLRERDETIARLQRQLAEAESRPSEPVYERELQQSFVLSTPPSEVDELADDPLADDELP